jgi:hypothetical protein
VTGKKRTAREPLWKCRKRRDDVKTAGVSLLRDQAPTKPVYGRSGIRHERWPELAKEAVERNVGTWDFDANGEATSGSTTRARVRMRSLRGGAACSSYEVPDKGMERRRCVREPNSMSQPVMGGAR